MRKETSKIQITAKLLVAAAAIVHLIFTYVHTNALLLLEDQICGFIMFLFVLLGLVTLFEATQIHGERIREEVLTALLCGCSWLVSTSRRSKFRATWMSRWYKKQFCSVRA